MGTDSVEARAGGASEEGGKAALSGPQPALTDGRMSLRVPVRRWSGPLFSDAHDDLAIEEPLQIRLAGEDVAVTMRTPGHDEELAAGFLYTEGVISGKAHIDSIGPCLDDAGAPAGNIVNVLPTERGLLEPGRWGRNFYANSSCGLCGKTSLEYVTTRKPAPSQSRFPVTVSLHTLYGLPSVLRAAQHTFARTGGIHAAALFDAEGRLLAVREDVGRHNAVDKIVGYALLNDMLPLHGYVLLVSSRASFEVVQKAYMAGVQVLAAVSAPSSLAVDLAREVGMTLVAFLRDGRLNVYTGEDRITPSLHP